MRKRRFGQALRTHRCCVEGKSLGTWQRRPPQCFRGRSSHTNKHRSAPPKRVTPTEPGASMEKSVTRQQTNGNKARCGGTKKDGFSVKGFFEFDSSRTSDVAVKCSLASIMRNCALKGIQRGSNSAGERSNHWISIMEHQRLQSVCTHHVVNKGQGGEVISRPNLRCSSIGFR